MTVKRMSKILRELPEGPVPSRNGKWRFDDPYIIDEKGDVVCQWQSYSTRRTARLIIDSVNAARGK